MEEKELKVIQKAQELFMQYGIKSVSMDDIATHLSMSKKTIYKVVKDKKDLVGKVLDYNFETNSAKVEETLTPDLNAIEQMIELIKFVTWKVKYYSPNMIFDLQKFYPEEYLKLQKRKNKVLQEFYTYNFEKGIEEGLYRENMNVSVISRIIIYLTEKIIDNDQFTIEELCSPDFVVQLYLYHLHGIVSEKGLKILNEFENNFKYE